MRIWPIIIIFLIIGGYVIVRTHQIDLRDGGGRTEFMFKFSRWIFHMGGNMKDLAGYAVKMEWMPEQPVNETSE